jgi:Ribonuclease G/E
VFSELEREYKGSGISGVTLRVNPLVADVALLEERQALEDLEASLRLMVQVVADKDLHIEHFVLSPEE